MGKPWYQQPKYTPSPIDGAAGGRQGSMPHETQGDDRPSKRDAEKEAEGLLIWHTIFGSTAGDAIPQCQLIQPT